MQIAEKGKTDLICKNSNNINIWVRVKCTIHNVSEQQGRNSKMQQGRTFEFA